MPTFGLFVVRAPAGTPTVTAVRSERLADSVPRLRRLKQEGFLVRPLGQVSVEGGEPETARLEVMCHVRRIFMNAPFHPPVALVW